MTIDDPQNTIAFQGIPGAHSDMACKIAYPYLHTYPCASFEEAFMLVREGKLDKALIPIENSRAGRVAEVHNLLPNSDLHITGEYFHAVRHHLLGIKGSTLEDVKTVYSHPQALMQCRQQLQELGVKSEPYFDTAAAAQKVAEDNDPSKAALASNLAGELYGLDILKEDMQDADDNTTLFLTFEREPADPDPEGSEKILTSMLFTTRNISAGLYKALGGFATNGVNLFKLESYIPTYNTGTAQFFITFEGHPQQKHVQAALDEFGFFTSDVQLLGVYLAHESRYKQI